MNMSQNNTAVEKISGISEPADSIGQKIAKLILSIMPLSLIHI